MKKIFTWLLFTVSLSASLPALAQNFAISLDGATNAVTTTAQIVPAGADFTVEFWAYVPSLVAGFHEFVSQGTAGSGSFYLGYDGGTGNIRAGDAWANTGVQVPVGRWFHLALTYFNTTTTATLYIDDVIQSSNPTYSITGGGTNFALGIQTTGSEFMQAEMDELRIWNVARTQAEIKGSMLRGASPFDPTFAQLIAYYQMNEGSGTTLDNATSTTGLNGTLIGTVTGTTWASSPIQYALNALDFDGLGDTKVVVPPNALWDGLNQSTIEFNINLGPNIASKGDVISVHSGTFTKFSILVFSSGIQFYDGTTVGGVGVTLTPGTWHHISVVTDGVADTTGIYIDGVEPPSSTIPQSYGTATGLPLVMGVTTAGTDNENYDGGLDEVRIWNTMLTPAQINTFMNVELVGNEPNLIALYDFNYGNAGGSNSFLTTAYDGTANNNHGTLTGFALSGSTSNFIAGNSLITPLPVNFVSFTATAMGKEALLQWQTAQEQNSKDFTILRSPDGSPNSFIPIGTVAAAGNSSTALSYSFRDVSPLLGLNYYQLKETDLDNHFMYSPIRSLIFNEVGTGIAWYRTGVKAVEVDLIGGNSEWYLVTDMLGRTIQEGQLSFGKMYLNNVPTGVYLVKILSANGAQRTTKVLVQ